MHMFKEIQNLNIRNSIPLDSLGFPWIPLNFLEISWIPLESLGIPWILLDPLESLGITIPRDFVVKPEIWGLVNLLSCEFDLVEEAIRC